MSYTTDAARWRALTIRDAEANGRFVYSVRSTNIYCRPICPARLARRANIGFFQTPAEAEAAGFRACKRCKPNEDNNDDPQERAVAKARKLIEDALKDDKPKAIRLQELAKNVGLTPRYFHKVFKDKTGMTPKEYANSKADPSRPETHVTMLAAEGPALPGTLDPDNFDFNDWIDFPSELNVSNDFTLIQGIPAQPMPATFGQEIDVNIQPACIVGPLGPFSLEPDAKERFDSQTKLASAPLTSAWDSGGGFNPLLLADDLDAAFTFGVEPWVEDSILS